MNRPGKATLFSVLIIIAFSSCVSTRKYEDALAREMNLRSRNEQLTNEIEQLKRQIVNMERENAQLIQQIDAAMKRAADASGMANITQKQLEAEQKRLWDLRRLL